MSVFSDPNARFPRPLVFISLAALILRVVYLLVYSAMPDWTVLTVDNYFHLHWAEDMAGGNILGDTTYFRAPFYVYCLAILDFLFGSSLWIARIFGLLIGVGAVVLTFLIARRMFSEREGIIAASIHLLFPTVLYFELEILLDSLFMFFIELAFYRFLICRDINTKQNWLWLGISLGLAAITRPTALIFTPFVLALILLQNGVLKEQLLKSILLLAGMLLLILPITLRNIVVGGEPVLIAAQGGINFYIGNNHQADGLSASMPEPLGHNWHIKDITFIAEQETNKKLKPGEVSSYWFGRTIDEIVDHPVSAFNLFLKKIYFNVSNYEISNNRNLSDFFHRHVMLKYNPFSFALIFALALFGVAAGWKSHDGVRLIVVTVIIYIVSVSLFFFNSRFRLPILPFYFILFAVAIETFTYNLRTSRRSLIIPIIVGLSAGLISHLPPTALTKGNTSQHLITQGLKLYSQNDFKGALKQFGIAAEIDSTFPETNLNIGTCQLRLGSTDSALYYFEREKRFHPQRALSYSNIAAVELLNGHFERALHEAAKAISLKPYHPQSHLIRLKATAESDIIDSNVFYEVALQSIQQSDRDPSVMNFAAIILTNRGDFQNAKQILTLATQSKPTPIEISDDAFLPNFHQIRTSFSKEIAKAHYQLGFIFGMESDFRLSIINSRRALELDSTLAEAYLNLANGYGAIGEIEQADSAMSEMRQRFPDHNYFLNK